MYITSYPNLVDWFGVLDLPVFSHKLLTFEGLGLVHCQGDCDFLARAGIKVSDGRAECQPRDRRPFELNEVTVRVVGQCEGQTAVLAHGQSSKLKMISLHTYM